MARKKTIKLKEDTIQKTTVSKEEAAQKPMQLNKEISCVIGSSYIIEYPDFNNFTTTVLLNGEQIEGEISNINGKYKGIKLVKKNGKFIIYTGKHSLSSIEDTISGIFTIQFMEI